MTLKSHYALCFENLNEDRLYCQRRRCTRMTLDSDNIRFTRIFVGVPWKGGVIQQWGNRKRVFFGLSDAASKMEMGHLSWPMTHVTHHTVDLWPTWPMAITSFNPTHGTRRGRGMVVLDNPLGLESKKSYIKIKPPAMIIGLIEWVSSFLMSTKNKVH